MKFSVAKEKLLEGLQQVQNVVSTRTTLPILSNVLLQAHGDEIHLTTTDLDVGVRGLRDRELPAGPRVSESRERQRPLPGDEWRGATPGSKSPDRHCFWQFNDNPKGNHSDALPHRRHRGDIHVYPSA